MKVEITFNYSHVVEPGKGSEKGVNSRVLSLWRVIDIDQGEMSGPYQVVTEGNWKEVGVVVKTRLVFGTSHYKCCSTCLTLVQT